MVESVHVYLYVPHKPWRKIKMCVFNHQTDCTCMEKESFCALRLLQQTDYPHKKLSIWDSSRLCMNLCYVIFLCALNCVKMRYIKTYYYYLLGKGGYVFGSVGLSVCLSVDSITQKVMDGLEWNFMEGSWVVQWMIKIWWWSEYSKMSKWAKTHHDSGSITRLWCR